MYFLIWLAAVKLVVGWQNESGNPLLTDQAQSVFALNLTGLTNFSFPQPPRVQTVLTTNFTDVANLSTLFLPSVHDITLNPDGKPLRSTLNVTATNFTIEPLGGFGQCDAGIGCCPDPRYNFRDTTYPWRATGRILSAIGSCTGSLVGPRHVLTASHCVDWVKDRNGLIGWLEFQPSFYDTPVFSNYFAEYIYWAAGTEKGDPDSEEGVGSDYVVAVLSERAGDQLGWFGTRSYSTDWNGGKYWAHVGYAFDVGGTNRPTYLGPFAISDAWTPGFFGTENGLDIEFQACVSPGDSGGPLIGWWSDGPYIVGTVSGSGELPAVLRSLFEGERKGNWAAGGSQMVNLVRKARSDYP